MYKFSSYDSIIQFEKHYIYFEVHLGEDFLVKAWFRKRKRRSWEMRHLLLSLLLWNRVSKKPPKRTLDVSSTRILRWVIEAKEEEESAKHEPCGNRANVRA